MFAFNSNNGNGNGNSNENGKKLSGLLEAKLKNGVINRFSIGLTYEAETFPIPSFFVVLYTPRRLEGTMLAASSVSKLMETVESFFNNLPT